MAADRASVSAIDAKLSGLASDCGARLRKRRSRQACSSRPRATATDKLEAQLGFHVALPPARSLVRREIAFGIGQDHIAHGLVIFDVAGAAADMAVERLGDGVSRDRRAPPAPSPALQQHLALVEEARGAIAALEREMLDEGLLQRRQFAVLRMPSTVRMDLPSKLAAETTQVGLV